MVNGGDGVDAGLRNQAAYQARWGARRRLVQMRPHLWRELAPALRNAPVLEIGAGLRPTVPPAGAYFADIHPEALRALQRAGGRPVNLINGIPLPDQALAGVLAFEVLEHVEDDASLLAEMARTVRAGGLLVCSVPLRMRHWSRLDEEAGHVRRYEPSDLFAKVRGAGFELDRVEYRYGHPSRFADWLAVWMLRRLPRLTNGTLQHIIFPVQSALQRRFGRLKWTSPDEPVPAAATGVSLVATRAEPS